MPEKYLPHNWLGLKGLSVAWTVLFYATLAFGVYTAYNWILVLQLPEEFWQQNSAPLIRIYGFATGAAFLAAAVETGILRVLAALNNIENATAQK